MLDIPHGWSFTRREREKSISIKNHIIFETLLVKKKKNKIGREIRLRLSGIWKSLPSYNS